MRDYILRRLLLVPVTLFGISLITFLIIHMAPGDPAQMKVSPGVGGEQQADKNVSRETYERTLEQFDLDKPLFMQYVRWVGRLAGINFKVRSAKKDYKAEVTALLIEKFKASAGDSIESRRKEIAETVARQDALLPAEERAERAQKQLSDWVQAQAEETRFRYTTEIGAIRAGYRQEHGDAFESKFSWMWPELNRTKENNWYPFDFGRSFKTDREVREVLLEKIPRSLELSLISIFLAYIIAIPLGIHSSVSQGTVSDRVITTTLFVLYSLPSFWVAIMLLLLVSAGGIGIGLFPVGGLWPEPESADQSMWSWHMLSGHAMHLVMPVFCLTYASFAYISRQMRAGMLEVVRQDFIRTARAKGLPEHVVILKHALRNSLIPIITIVAVILPSLVGGSVIIETIFNIDGVGGASFAAILNRDYPIIMAIFTLSALLTLMGILLSDVLYALVDPQISFEGK